jgi:serine/threonine-protein kinase
VALREPPGDSPLPSDLTAQPVGTAGRNLLFGEIARGGMGAVVRGRDPDLGRDLAVKMLLEKHRDNPELSSRFLEEAQIAGQLQHPGVVPVYELGRLNDNRPFFSMKLVKGQTLASLLDQRVNPLENLSRFLAIFEQTCQTVAYAHARGVIHRDLKPLNVMVGSFGEVQVMDWGLAKLLSRGETPGSPLPPANELTNIRTVPSGSQTDGQRAGTLFGIGTFGYMPQEQALGETDQIDERADVFALGAILCLILTGQPPFAGSAEEVKRQTCRGDLEAAFARLGTAGVDAELVRLAKSCLAVRREERPRNAGEVAGAMTAYLAGVAERLRAAELAQVAAQARAEEEAKARVLAEQVAVAERAKALHERKARRMTLALAASVLLTVLVVGSGGLWLKHQADTRDAERAAELAKIRRDVERALQEAASYRHQALQLMDDLDRWEGALRSAQQAAGEAKRLADAAAAPDDLAGRVRALLVELKDDEKDLKMVRRLEHIRADASAISDGKLNHAAAKAAYRQAFRDYGLDPLTLPARKAADRIRLRPIKEQLLVGLNDWSTASVLSMSDKAPWPARLKAPLPKWINEITVSVDPQSLVSAAQAVETHDENIRINAPAVYVVPNTQEFASQTRLQRYNLARAYHLTENWPALEGLLRYEQRARPQDYNANASLGFFLWVIRKPPRMEEAARFYTAALALRPHDEHSHLILAELLLNLQDHEELERVCRKALALKLKSSAAHSHRLLALAQQRQGRHAEAVDSWQAALRLKPAEAIYHFGLNFSLRSCGKPAEALAALRQAVRLDPQNSIYHLALAEDLRGANHFKEAVVEYRQAISCNKANDLAYEGLGRLFDQQGKTAAAVEAFRKAVFLKPKEPRYHHWLGIIFNKTQETDKAIEEYETVIKLKPGDAEYLKLLRLNYKQRVRELALAGKFDEAVTIHRKVLELEPTDKETTQDLVRAYTVQAQILFLKGKPTESIAALRKALELDPADAGTWETLGAYLTQYGQTAEAKAAFRKVLELKPTRFSRQQLKTLENVDEQVVTAEYNRGYALFHIGKFKEACVAFGKVVDLKPNWPAAHWTLGASYARAGELTKALEQMERCKEFGPPLNLPPDEGIRTLKQLIELDRKLPALVEGKEKPGDVDRIELAQLCMVRKFPRAAVRFYAEAFALNPNVPTQVNGPRYSAACAAALAAAGKGKDVAKLDEKERAHLRKQAFEWLSADLAQWSKQAESDQPQERERVQQMMKHWQTDTDLAGIRDAESMAKLSAAEQARWRKLWADVEAVLKKSQRKAPKK